MYLNVYSMFTSSRINKNMSKKDGVLNFCVGFGKPIVWAINCLVLVFLNQPNLKPLKIIIDPWYYVHNVSKISTRCQCIAVYHVDLY